MADIVHYYSSAQAGAGKTRKTLPQVYSEAANGNNNFIYSAPTTLLLQQAKDQLQHLASEKGQSSHVEILRIDSKVNDSGLEDLSATRLCVEAAMKEPKLHNEGRIILITNETLFRLRGGDYQSNYSLLMDEGDKTFGEYTLNLGKGQARLPSDVYLKELDISNLRDIQPSEAGKATLNKAISGDSSSELWRGKSARSLAADIMSDLVRVELLNPNGTTGLSFMYYRSPKVLEYYKDVTLLCANAKDTFHYQLWKLQGVEFKLKAIDGLLNSDTFGHLGHQGFIHIHYVLNEGITKGKHVSNPMFMHEFQKMAYEFFKEKGLPYIYCLNTAGVTDFEPPALGKKIKVICHGLNNWRHYCGAAYFASTNLNELQLKSLRAMGMTKKQIHKALKCQNVYQMVCRTYVRWSSVNENKHIHFVVPDLEIAEYLETQFTGSKVQKLGDIENNTEVFPVGTKTKRKARARPVFNKKKDLRMAKNYLVSQGGFKPINPNVSKWAKEHKAYENDLKGLVSSVLTNFSLTESELKAKRL